MTNTPKTYQEIGKPQMLISIPLCLPPNPNLSNLQDQNLLPLGTKDQS
jgi:hypothetical protein